jgi:hypothetical protein
MQLKQIDNLFLLLKPIEESFETKIFSGKPQLAISKLR